MALRIDSQVTNNEAEYEAVLAGIRAAREVGASRIILYSDSQLITQQIKGVYEAKDDRMLKYLQLIKTQLEVFMDWGIEQIPQEENNEADAWAKMAASISEASTREVLHVSRLILSTDEETIPEPEDSWMTSLIKFITTNELPEDKSRAQKIKRQVPRFVLLNNVLYRRSFQGPLLKCLSKEKVDYVLREVHEGCCAEHLGGVSLARKTLAGFWWPTLDSTRIVRACEDCQYHSNFQHSPATPMRPIWASCPFDQWGMDIVEAEPLAKITEQKVLKFLWKNIVCRFGVPRRLISDNGRQFQGKGITSWCREMKITQYFTSVAYPQANGQKEVPGHGVGFGRREERLSNDLDGRIPGPGHEIIQQESPNPKLPSGGSSHEESQSSWDVGKLETRWEGPYRITRRVSSGSFYLEDAQGHSLKRPWNVFHLKKYYA
ncbi:uncharacterized protein LOC142504983 [Primulina tabacum]|uniref:uncharacterized protein LOC142504983 n=1 Tax=Primulina tabacum TaxID=48773 RepID=UPI003F5AC350